MSRHEFTVKQREIISAKAKIRWGEPDFRKKACHSMSEAAKRRWSNYRAHRKMEAKVCVNES